MKILFPIFLVLICIQVSISIIIEGTKWCGIGNKAKNCSDYGEYEQIDKCCQIHDNCPFQYTVNYPTHNGFSWNGYYTLSHCECDLKFNECLFSKPLKGIESFLDSIKVFQIFGMRVKCFGLLPCDETNLENVSNGANKRTNRKSGACLNGFKVTLFDHVDDYYNYLSANLSEKQKLDAKHLIESHIDRFIFDKKRRFKDLKCINETFSTYKTKIVTSFNNRFLSTN